MRPRFDFGVLWMTPAATAAQWRQRARWTEDAGFASFQLSDHFDRSPVSPLVTLAAVAQVTSRLRLGALVLNNDFRHPAVLAKEAATLDLLCDGRLELGLGAGWMTADYAVSGIERRPAGRRIERLAETVTILDRVLGGSEPATVHGRHYSVDTLAGVPAAVSSPRPPLLVGCGGSPRVLSLAGRVADIVGINLDVAEGRVGPRAARSAYADATDEKLRWVREAAGGREIRLHLVAYWAEVTEHPREAAARRIAAQGLQADPEEFLASPHCLIGPAGRLTERLAELQQRWGFDYVSLYDSDAESFAPVLAAVARA